MACETKAVKCILYFFNVIMILGGAIIIYNVSQYLSVLSIFYIIFMYTIGTLNLLCGVLGVLGICREHANVMKTYAGIILLTIIIQLIGKCFGSKFDELIKESAKNKVELRWQDEIKYPGAMNQIQRKFYCCGKDSPRDYINVLHRSRLPITCFKDIIIPVEEGCLLAVEKSVVESFTQSEKSGWINLALMAFLFGLAWYLSINLMNKHRRDNYKN